MSKTLLQLVDDLIAEANMDGDQGREEYGDGTTRIRGEIEARYKALRGFAGTELHAGSALDILDGR